MGLLEWIGAGLVAVALAFIAGRRKGTQAAAVDKLKQEDAAHARINDADLGIGASDAERVDRLRDFADRHGG